MAKGNDGNYLQHSLEIAIAVHLARAIGSGKIHIALTHGMAPFERCGDPPPGQTRRLLQQALDAAQSPPTDDEPGIVHAYRATRASFHRYPNSGELIAAVIGRGHLTGGITELDPGKHAELQEVWSSSDVAPVNASWRKQISPGGVHWAPSSLRVPWLFSVDPMTYCEIGDSDDDNLYRADLAGFAAVLNSYVRRDLPGAATLFVYAVRPAVQPRFWSFVDELADEVRMSAASYWITHQGGNRNLAATLCSFFSLPAGRLPPGVKRGR